MDIKLMLTTFGLVFLAELGDKTQLATVCLSADCDQKQWSVFIGASVALIVCSFIAVVLGAAFDRWIPAIYVKIGAGVFFMIAGLWILISAFKGA